MLITFVTAALLNLQQPNTVQRFREIATAEVPAVLFGPTELLCEGLESIQCRQDFLEKGKAWAGDLNDDGVRELLLRATVLGGTGGDAYFLFQQHKESWAPLTVEAGGWLTTTGLPRFDILPIVRGGYHDIRVDVEGCFKWNGKGYVPYEVDDFKKLTPAWFDSSKLEEAELFWAIRYRGAQKITFQPQWFPGVPKWSSNVELEDTRLGLQWVAMFKGGIYAVKKDESFLLLPHPAYGGAETLELQGDWLVAYATVIVDRAHGKSELRPVVRYNRRDGELKIMKYEQ